MKEEGRFRVFCADDLDIALEGMKRILELDSRVDVVGQSSRREDVVPAVARCGPDILLVDLQWGGVLDAGCDIIRQVRRESPEIAIVAITVHDGLIEDARQAGAHSVATKDISARDLVALVEAVADSQRPVRAAYSCLQKLHHIPIGDWKCASEHETCILELLRFCFQPELTGWQSQLAVVGQVERPDIICTNYSQHPFWSTIRQVHSAHQIVIEVKNSSKLSKRHLEQLSLSLGGLRGRFGLLVGRNPPSAAFRRAAYLPYANDRKVILSIADHDLENMLKLKTQGADPTQVIIARYESFLRPYVGT